MQIDIEVIGTYCNTWPNLIVEINQDKIFDGGIENTQKIHLQYNKLKDQKNSLVIGMNNKSFGKQGVWDTKFTNNKIIQDKTITVSSLLLDGVEVKDLFERKFYVKRADRQPTYFPDVVESIDVMNYNGYFGFEFDLPLYNSLTNKKFKRDLENASASYFSNYSKVFHYEGEKKIIKDIYKILGEIDEKFSSKRSQIRNP